MTLLATFTDGIKSMVANLGTGRDKMSSVGYAQANLTDDQIFNMYRGSWMARKIVDIPADDATRKWREWQAGNKEIEAIEDVEKQFGVKAKIRLAQKMGRLWGGGAVLIGDGSANPSEPLDVDRIKKGGLKYLTVLSRRTLTGDANETDVSSPYFGKPKSYRLNTAGNIGLPIHPSRLVLFNGESRCDEDSQISGLSGWGDSVLMANLDAIKHADAVIANIASLVFEAKVDVISVPDLMQSLSDPDYEKRLLTRFDLAMRGKGINGTLLLDANETYSQKSASFAQLPDLMSQFMQIVSGAADIPATRFLGQSPSGMTSTGESDTRNYYDLISSMQELDMSPAMAVLDEVIIRSALGARPDEVHYKWASLWQMNDKEKAEIGKADAETVDKLVATGLYPQEVLSKVAMNRQIESGYFPGLEAAMAEFKEANPTYFEAEDPSVIAGPDAALQDK